MTFNQRWARVRMDGGGVKAMVGGVKKFWSFFSFLQNFGEFFCDFYNFVAPIWNFYGGIPHRKPFKIFMMEGQFKVHDGGTPPPSPPVPSMPLIDLIQGYTDYPNFRPAPKSAFTTISTMKLPFTSSIGGSATAPAWPGHPTSEWSKGRWTGPRVPTTRGSKSTGEPAGVTSPRSRSQRATASRRARGSWRWSPWPRSTKTLEGSSTTVRGEKVKIMGSFWEGKRVKVITRPNKSETNGLTRNFDFLYHHNWCSIN